MERHRFSVKDVIQAAVDQIVGNFRSRHPDEWESASQWKRRRIRRAWARKIRSALLTGEDKGVKL